MTYDASRDPTGDDDGDAAVLFRCRTSHDHTTRGGVRPSPSDSRHQRGGLAARQQGSRKHHKDGGTSGL
jgi:hypothetical protein